MEEDLKRVFLTTIGLGTLVYFIVSISQGYWKRRGILHQKPKFLYGNTKGLGKKRHISEILGPLYDEYKGRAPFIGFYIYIKPFVLALDLELVRQVLSTGAEDFMARGIYQNISGDPLSCNLSQLDGTDWQQMHTKITPAFAKDKIDKLLPRMLQLTKVFRNSLATKQGQQSQFIIDDLIDCYSVDVISTLAFRLTGDTLTYPNTEFRDMTRKYNQNFNILRAYLLMEYTTVARFLQYQTYDQTATDYFMKIISDHLIMDEESNKARIGIIDEDINDFLQLFLAADNSEQSFKKRLDYREIAAHAFTFILNGLVPLNSTLTFCLYELALQPDLQVRARAEIQSVLKQYNGELTPESLKEFKYLKQILKETLRLHSPYPFLLRQTTKPYEIRNSVFMLAKDDYVIIPIAAIHHDADIYPEPTRFDPDRFSDEAVKDRHPFAWLPYGAGPRGCVAMYFAELTLLIGLISLLECYQYSPCADTSIPLQYDASKLMLTPKSKIKLIVERVEYNSNT